MNIKRTKLIPTYYKVQAFCECGGEVEFIGVIKTSSPPWYVHKCPRCDKTEDFREKYPGISTEWIESNTTKSVLDGSEVTTEYLNDR